MRTYPFKLMKRIILFNILIIFWSLIAFAAEKSYSKGNVQLLEKYDFNKGNFSIAGVVWHDQRNNLQKSLGNFYTDDVEVLNMLKKSWITEKPSPFYACGYHFRIFIIDEGKEEESFFINVEKGCNTVVTEYGQFYFDPNKISKFKDKFKKPITKRIHFDTCQEGRNYLKSLDNDDNLLIYLKPRWLKYDGEFRFYVNCDNTQFSSPEAQRCLNNVKNRIAIKFPAEKFYIEQSGYSKTQILVTMKCNNDLYNEFDLYDIEWTWSEYSPNLTVLFKSKK